MRSKLTNQFAPTVVICSFSMLILIGCNPSGENPSSVSSIAAKPQVETSSQIDLGDSATSDQESESQDDTTDESVSYAPQSEDEKPEVQTIVIPDTWKRLSKEQEIWIDTKNREVIVAGAICLNRGPLEMFVCPEGTKEHESVVSVNALASQVHACLIALKADPGKPTSWDPEYKPAHGPSIDVTMIWKDEESGKVKKQNGKEWIRDSRTKKAMDLEWVFGGSEIWVDPDTKEKLYYGDSGELICLSNFSTATIDVNVESSQSTAGLLFEAFTENIPAIGTKVYVVIKPGKVIKPEKKADKPDQKIVDDPKSDETASDEKGSEKATTSGEDKQDSETKNDK